MTRTPGQPVFWRQLPDGSMLFDFDGHVHARGLDLDSGNSAVAQSERTVRWLESTDLDGGTAPGSEVARLREWSIRKSGGVTIVPRNELILEALAPAGAARLARNNLDARDPSNGVFAGIRVETDGSDTSHNTRSFVTAGNKVRNILCGDGSSDFHIGQSIAVYSDSGADVAIPNDTTFRTVAQASGSLGDGAVYTVPSGESHTVNCSARLLVTADSANWTTIQARLFAWSNGSRYATAPTTDRGFGYGYNVVGNPDWFHLRPEAFFTLAGGASYSFYLEVLANNPYGGWYTRSAGWNQILTHRV